MKQYLHYTRSPWISYLFVLPLLLLYQATALIANLGAPRGVINGADALIQRFFSVAGLHGWLGSWLALALVAGVLVYRADPMARKARLRKEYFGLMLLESAVYAMLFGSVVASLTALILPGGGSLQIGGGAINFGQALASSLGAGLYEELVFRLLLTGGLIWTFGRFRWKPGAAIAAAVLLSSTLFSLFHYIGPLGETFQIASFAFRFVAGVVLACLYSTRGFAVAAWTHALYDVFLLMLGRG
jgi:hypothetical protein